MVLLFFALLLDLILTQEKRAFIWVLCGMGTLMQGLICFYMGFSLSGDEKMQKFVSSYISHYIGMGLLSFVFLLVLIVFYYQLGIHPDPNLIINDTDLTSLH